MWPVPHFETKGEGHSDGVASDVTHTRKTARSCVRAARRLLSREAAEGGVIYSEDLT